MLDPRFLGNLCIFLPLRVLILIHRAFVLQNPNFRAAMLIRVSGVAGIGFDGNFSQKRH